MNSEKSFLEILVEKLQGGSGWPDGFVAASVSYGGGIIFHTIIPDQHNGFYWMNDSDRHCRLYGVVESLRNSHEPYKPITREQYESALAAKNGQWIKREGGECPVSSSEMVQVMFTSSHVSKPANAGHFRWQRGTANDIIAYRLHTPQPDENDWIEWGGSGCPVKSGTLVDVRYRDLEEKIKVPAFVNSHGSRDASYPFWQHSGASNDIVAYRLHKPLDANVRANDDRLAAEVERAAGQGNKYQRTIIGLNTEGKPVAVTVDVYDVLDAFSVTNSALQHLIKKALCTGLRGHKDAEEDLRDIIKSADRALELHVNAKKVNRV